MDKKLKVLSIGALFLGLFSFASCESNNEVKVLTPDIYNRTVEVDNQIQTHNSTDSKVIGTKKFTEYGVEDSDLEQIYYASSSVAFYKNSKGYVGVYSLLANKVIIYPQYEAKYINLGVYEPSSNAIGEFFYIYYKDRVTIYDYLGNVLTSFYYKNYAFKDDYNGKSFNDVSNFQASFNEVQLIDKKIFVSLSLTDLIKKENVTTYYYFNEDKGYEVVETKPISANNKPAYEVDKDHEESDQVVGNKYVDKSRVDLSMYGLEGYYYYESNRLCSIYDSENKLVRTFEKPDGAICVLLGKYMLIQEMSALPEDADKYDAVIDGYKYKVVQRLENILTGEYFKKSNKEQSLIDYVVTNENSSIYHDENNNTYTLVNMMLIGEKNICLDTRYQYFVDKFGNRLESVGNKALDNLVKLDDEHYYNESLQVIYDKDLNESVYLTSMEDVYVDTNSKTISGCVYKNGNRLYGALDFDGNVVVDFIYKSFHDGDNLFVNGSTLVEDFNNDWYRISNGSISKVGKIYEQLNDKGIWLFENDGVLSFENVDKCAYSLDKSFNNVIDFKVSLRYSCSDDDGTTSVYVFTNDDNLEDRVCQVVTVSNRETSYKVNSIGTEKTDLINYYDEDELYTLKEGYNTLTTLSGQVFNFKPYETGYYQISLIKYVGTAEKECISSVYFTEDVDNYTTVPASYYSLSYVNESGDTINRNVKYAYLEKDVNYQIKTNLNSSFVYGDLLIEKYDNPIEVKIADNKNVTISPVSDDKLFKQIKVSYVADETKFVNISLVNNDDTQFNVLYNEFDVTNKQFYVEKGNQYNFVVNLKTYDEIVEKIIDEDIIGFDSIPKTTMSITNIDMLSAKTFNGSITIPQGKTSYLYKLPKVVADVVYKIDKTTGSSLNLFVIDKNGKVVTSTTNSSLSIIIKENEQLYLLGTVQYDSNSNRTFEFTDNLYVVENVDSKINVSSGNLYITKITNITHYLEEISITPISNVNYEFIDSEGNYVNKRYENSKYKVPLKANGDLYVVLTPYDTILDQDFTYTTTVISDSIGSSEQSITLASGQSKSFTINSLEYVSRLNVLGGDYDIGNVSVTIYDSLGSQIDTSSYFGKQYSSYYDYNYDILKGSDYYIVVTNNSASTITQNLSVTKNYRSIDLSDNPQVSFSITDKYAVLTNDYDEDKYVDINVDSSSNYVSLYQIIDGKATHYGYCNSGLTYGAFEMPSNSKVIIYQYYNTLCEVSFTASKTHVNFNSSLITDSKDYTWSFGSANLSSFDGDTLSLGSFYTTIAGCNDETATLDFSFTSEVIVSFNYTIQTELNYDEFDVLVDGVSILKEEDYKSGEHTGNIRVRLSNSSLNQFGQVLTLVYKKDGSGSYKEDKVLISSFYVYVVDKQN